MLLMKIFLISELNNNMQQMQQYIEKMGHECIFSKNEEAVREAQIKDFAPDIVIVDTAIKNSDIITKKVKTMTREQNTQVILILSPNKDLDFLNFADGFMMEPVSSSILKNTINSHINIKQSLDKLCENNKDLSRSLYQLNVLYNTSSQFAGTLDKNKLYNIMLEGLEKTLSFDISAALVFGKDNSANLFINSLHQPSDSLREALKLRLMLKYKNLFLKKDLPYDLDFGDVHNIEKFKPSHMVYDLRALNFDTLSAPVKVGEDFFGVIEIFRQVPFSKEDVTCFQTIAHQVALPLRSATLYEEIKQTNIKLEKLEKLKSEFISIVSHELRTPLTPINNSLEIVLTEQAGPISDDAKNFIKMAKRNVTRLSGIIEDLLDLSRAQTGKLDFKFKKAQLRPSLELTKETFMRMAEEKQMSFALNLPEKIPQVYADTNRIEQVLSNLATNAIKFTPKGGKIEVFADVVNAKEIDTQKLISPKTSLSGDYVRICTKDSGIGIGEADIPKIFDKFSQIENSLTRNIGGVGLGLSITKQLVDAHCGAIAVESKKNEGSNFCFFLPVLNTQKMFHIDLLDAINTGQEFGLIYIQQNAECAFSEHLKVKKIIKLTKESKELLLKEGDREHYFAITLNMDSSVLEFMEKTVNAELEKNKKWQKCDILFRKASTEKECDTIIKVLEDLGD